MASPQIGLRERKKARTRQHIIEVTLELIRERGYDKATVDEIVRRVEISPPTFYSYFLSKDDVLAAVAVEQLEEWARVSEAELGRRRSTRSHLRRLYRAMAKGILAERELWRAILLANAIDPYTRPEQREADRRGVRVLERILEDGQARGEVSRRFDPASLAERLDRLQFVTCRVCAAESADLDGLADALDEGVEFFLHGARPRP